MTGVILWGWVIFCGWQARHDDRWVAYMVIGMVVIAAVLGLEMQNAD